MSADRVQRVIREHLCTGEKPLTSSARLVEDLGADSLDQVELQMSMEEVFGIAITDDEAEGCTTVGNWIDLIADKKGGA
jgi:acyl carrier protein